MTFKTLDDIADLNGKRVLVRVDFNIPVRAGNITDTTRIERVVPTIQELSKRGAKVILLAHFGRPKGKTVKSMSLRPIANAVEEILDTRVYFADHCVGASTKTAIDSMNNGDILLLENTRFHVGEENNSPDFIKALAENGDIYVNDAFSAAHRAHASTEGLARVLPSYAGRTMQAELEALDKCLGNPARPVMAIVGGAKVSTKIDLLHHLIENVDILVIGGAMANTFLAAQGVNIGKSLCEQELTDTAHKIMAKADSKSCDIILPMDVVIAREMKANIDHQTVSIEQIPRHAMILDAGPESVNLIKDQLTKANTLIWNGPLGAFEIEPFDNATVAIAQYISTRTREGLLLSVAGGGDTVSALNHANVTDTLSYVSLAGGAFLEWMEGKSLPGIEALC